MLLLAWLAEVLEYDSESPCLDNVLKNGSYMSSRTLNAFQIPGLFQIGFLCRRKEGIYFHSPAFRYPVSPEADVSAMHSDKPWEAEKWVVWPRV